MLIVSCSRQRSGDRINAVGTWRKQNIRDIITWTFINEPPIGTCPALRKTFIAGSESSLFLLYSCLVQIIQETLGRYHGLLPKFVVDCHA